MTPLAQEMLRFSLDSGTTDPEGIVLQLPTAGLFEITAIVADVWDLADALVKRPLLDTNVAKLPFPVCWLEYADADGSREGWMLEASDDEGCELVSSRFAWSFAPPDQRLATIDGPFWHSEFSDMASPSGRCADLRLEDEAWCRFLRAAIILINSPRAVQQICEPPPPRGFRRAFRRSDHPMANQELPGWHRILLPHSLRHPTSGQIIERGSGVALHRVRRHQRVLPDRVTWVRAHDRGDPSFGVRRSYYDVNPS